MELVISNVTREFADIGIQWSSGKKIPATAELQRERNSAKKDRTVYSSFSPSKLVLLVGAPVVIISCLIFSLSLQQRVWVE